MAKRSEYERDSKWVKDEVEVLEVEETPEPLETKPATVLIVLLRDINLKILGPVTRKLYHVKGSGSVFEVDEADAPQLLTKTSGRSCCGGESSKWFGLA